MGNPLVLAAAVTATGALAAAVLAWLSQRSNHRIDAREAAAARAVEVAERAAVQLEEARKALLAVKDDHIAMLSAELDKVRAQNADLAAKVAAYESRPVRRDDTCGA